MFVLNLEITWELSLCAVTVNRSIVPSSDVIACDANTGVPANDNLFWTAD